MEHTDKYIYVLAYGVSVTERWDGEERRSINTKRLEQTISAIEVLFDFTLHCTLSKNSQIVR